MFEQLLHELFGAQDPGPAARLVAIIIILALTWVLQRAARLLVVRFVRWIIVGLTRLRKTDVQVGRNLNEQLAGPIQILVVILGLRLALTFVVMSSSVEGFTDLATVNLLTLVIGWMVYRVLNVVFEFYLHSAKADAFLDETMVRFARQITVFILFVFVAMLLLQQWGQDVGAIVAGFGIASLAVALAAQEALANIIAYFAIILDAPFKVGDFVEMDKGVRGRVQEISFRSTRIRTLDHSIMIIPNRHMADATVINWARTRKRRLDILLGVTYGTSAEQIQAVLGDIKAMLDEHELVSSDRIVVEFVEYGESSLNLRVTFLARSSTWEDLEAVKTDINLQIMRILKKHDVSIAFPTRMIHVAEPDHAPLQNKVLADTPLSDG